MDTCRGEGCASRGIPARLAFCRSPCLHAVGRPERPARAWRFDPLRRGVVVCATSSPGFGEGEFAEGAGVDELGQGQNFSIIESRESVGDFENMQADEIEVQIESRRNKIFLLMEEVRRLKIQQKLKGNEKTREEEIKNLEYESAIPVLQGVPFLYEKNIKKYYTVYFWIVAGIILFGGLIAPTLEVKMGMGGQSYMEFIRSMHLPEQLAYVDPIVASFCGGAVGVLSSLLMVEVSNIKTQQRNRCYYCQGTGYLTCGNCVGAGRAEASACQLCSGTGKVMCANCFCTGKHMVTEHDPRFDPFD